ncbi:MAG: hypothetical protein L0177_09415 [Chloroflexi bacterium]|nr:hypothetical protein [Chloroflexota bacterium]
MPARSKKQKPLDELGQLSLEDKLWIKEKLDAMLASETKRGLKKALEESWAANQQFSEEEIEEDVAEAIAQRRSAKPPSRPSPTGGEDVAPSPCGGERERGQRRHSLHTYQMTKTVEELSRG